MSSDQVGPARRARILFIDDQIEVAKTLSGLLTTLRVDCQFAEEGEAGLTRLLNDVFDLAVVDLRMPPDRWGGLWLLQQLADRQLHVDTVVLSGDAGQPETIEAMRLGADFVVKHDAQFELANRIRTALTTGSKTRAAYAASQLPAPIALPYQRMTAARDRHARLLAGLRTVEAAIRFCALVAIAVVRSRGRLDQAPLSRLAQPSMGTWLQFCRQLQPLICDHAIRRWISAACSKETDTLVRHRNDSVHGDGVPTAGVEQALTDVLNWLDFFVLACRSGVPLTLVVAGGMTYDGSGHSVDLATLAGAARSVSTSAVTTDRLITGRVYLHGPGSYSDMWPLILADPGESPGDWRAVLMEGISTRRNEIADDDRLRYVDVATGKRSTAADRFFGDLKS